VSDIMRIGFHGFVDSLQARINDVGIDVGTTFFSLSR
jgi:hypothetical protein